MPGVALEILRIKNRILKRWTLKKKGFWKKKQFCSAYVTQKLSMGSLKKFNQIGPAVLPAIANIYTNKYIRAKSLLYR